MERPLSTTFRSVKPRILIPRCTSTLKSPKPSPKTPPKSLQSLSPTSIKSNSSASARSSSKPPSLWSVYLILSTNTPIKTYVGVTTNFSRRLKQHNGELRGGAKASRAGRPWVCACIIRGFKDKSRACEFESRWKITSRKQSRRKTPNEKGSQADNGSLQLLQHRHAALDKVRCLIDCSHLRIAWKLSPV
ncbi:hypothetical protein RJ639_021400 [Escallonia herrerae]|uniref:GIY-YIG domain-containing protein n=1 Tax=Escallonia herrerae TaxID=1293975 RepID=A0AA88V3F8_9ASTE|nr:hypothetical protein RJ639_021400 [Escallonia herrerae]